jgi:hypothetical protein
MEGEILADLLGKGISAFLIALPCNVVDSMHGFFTNLTNELEITDFSLALPIHPKSWET